MNTSNLNTSTLRPGMLVGLKTTIKGNVRYVSQELEAVHKTAAGEQRAKWETERTVRDPEEHERAKVARAQARGLIAGVCVPTDFGLLCPQDRVAQLNEAVRDAKAIADDFNGGASITRVSVYVITGRIADNDLEAVRAVNSEVRDLLTRMESGVKNLDVKAVREAANKARSLGQMLNPEAQARVQEAIKAARDTARKIQAAGEAASIEIDRATLTKLRQARTAFLDMDDAPSTVAAPIEPTRAVDFDTSPIAPMSGGSVPVPAIEME